MLLMLLYFLFSSFFMFFKFFKKKIMVLLSLEMMFISIICLNMIFSYNSFGVSSLFSSMIFLTFMVLDSVFGLSLLVSSSRNSSSFSNFFFFF